ncbi:MAG TPA: calcium-binding protein [Candidatus Nitrosocosmicus sp.]
MNHNNLPSHKHRFQILSKKRFTIKNSFIFTTIGIILLIGLTNINFFEHTFAQSPSNKTSSSGTVISSPSTAHSSGGGKVISFTTSNSRPVQLAQIKSTIFTELSKCIISGACRPLMGSEGDDRIQGGNGSNVIIGLEGNDIIRGGTGDNVIIGGPGDNQLYGGSGNNIIVSSGSGINELYGGNKSNVLVAGDGSSLLVAGKGNDKLYGGGGNDVFIGGPGADYFSCGTAGSKSVVMNFNAAKGDDTDGNCGTVLGQ